MMLRQALLPGIAAVMILTACGKIDAPVDASYSPDYHAPEDVLFVRDQTLDYVREHYPDRAPAPDLQWEAADISRIANSASYAFHSGDWYVVIDYPKVRPQLMFYDTAVLNPSAGFAWKGQVDPDGTVTEIKGP